MFKVNVKRECFESPEKRPPVDPPNTVRHHGLIITFIGPFGKWRASRYRRKQGLPKYKGA